MSKELQRQEEIASIGWLMNSVKDLKVLTSEQERSLIQSAQAGLIRARDELVKRNLRLVVKKAKYFMGRGIPLEDLVQEGSMGLMRATELFDLTKTHKGKFLKFSTYATWWIDQKLYRIVTEKSKIVKVSQKDMSCLTAIKKIYMFLIETMEEDDMFGRDPTSEEVSAQFNRDPELIRKFGKMTPEKAKEMGRLIDDHISLDKQVGEDENLSLVDFLIDDSYSPEESTESRSDKAYIQYLLSFLTKEDSDFIRLKYGFIDHNEKTDRQMCVLLKIPAKEVKAREERILEILKEKGSMFELNTPIACNIVIERIHPECYHLVFNTVMKLANLDHTKTRCALNTIPVTIKHNTDQSLALLWREELSLAGAEVSITKYE